MPHIKVGTHKIPAYSLVELISKGIKKPVPGFTLMKMFDTNSLGGNLSQRDLAANNDVKVKEDLDLMKKF